MQGGVKMDKLILLVGPSGVGKTTIAQQLEKEGYNIIHSYTTRKPRTPNEWGHIFIDKSKLSRTPFTVVYDGDDNIPPFNQKPIAFKELYGELYFATQEQYKSKGISIYAVDPGGAERVQQNVKDAEIITIYLTADESIRYQRICSRELKKYKEVSIGKRMIIDIEADERIQEDKKIFSKCKCDYVVDANRELEQVVTDIKEIIKESN